MIIHKFYQNMQAELAANAVLQSAYERAPAMSSYDDITVVVIFFDKKLISKNAN